jgi:Tfp pilus assembly PilM family ATPase
MQFFPSQTIVVGSKDLNKAVAKTFNMDEAMAVKLKEEKAFVESNGDMQLFESMIPVFSTIRDELSKVLIYWKTQGKKEQDFKDISDIVLVGSDAMIAGFSRYMAVTTKIPARIGSVWTNVLSVKESIPNLPKKDSLNYGSVIGALLE